MKLENKWLAEKLAELGITVDEAVFEWLTCTYTDEKEQAFGREMTLKEALDMGWNSVIIYAKLNSEGKVEPTKYGTCYKTMDGDYETADYNLNDVIVLDDELVDNSPETLIGARLVKRFQETD